MLISPHPSPRETAGHNSDPWIKAYLCLPGPLPSGSQAHRHILKKTLLAQALFNVSDRLEITFFLTSAGLTSEREAGKRLAGILTFCTGAAHRVSRCYPQIFPQPMKIKAEQINRLVELLLKDYHSKDLIVLKAKETDIRAKIKDIITENFHEEEVIEEEARKMLASHAGQVKEMDHYKMFVLIKQKLAQKRGFIL